MESSRRPLLLLMVALAALPGAIVVAEELAREPGYYVLGSRPPGKLPREIPMKAGCTSFIMTALGCLAEVVSGKVNPRTPDCCCCCCIAVSLHDNCLPRWVQAAIGKITTGELRTGGGGTPGCWWYVWWSCWQQF
ncbi:hypothetical protein Nepgr_000590 [Nepenthes gracilis]|uniref:Uncharacterized protein n=1 Tax=Nepenthes gracilis TaxID=150966 RepID=A0AAD3P385_NEPGR|nr:hypothetical protein Nepgr_000590 [Nepenthes gracilis]